MREGTMKMHSLVLAALAGVMAVGCRADTPRLVGLPVAGAMLNTVSRIVVPDSFIVTGAAGGSSCEIVLVGGEWGTLVRVRRDGSVDSLTGRLPGARSGGHLQSLGTRGIVVWSNAPPFWGRIGVDLSVSVLPVPMHAWGGRVVGPPVQIDNGYVMVPFGDLLMPRRAPRPWQGAPLGYDLALDGAKQDSVGWVDDRGGMYLSWYGARTVPGSVNDTLILLNLESAAFSAWRRPYSEPIWVRTLPRYFEPPVAREELFEYPWLQFGGVMRSFLAVSQVESAAIAEDGTMFAIRNYQARWERISRPRLKTQGRWVVVSRGLEKYSHDGLLLERYALPSGIDVRWVGIGPHGRVFLRQGQHVLVIETAGDTERCPAMPRLIVVKHSDPPPVNGAAVSGEGGLVTDMKP